MKLRRRMVWACWAVVCLLSPRAGAQSTADALLEAIAGGLDASPVILCEFTQTRRIASLKRPVVASGRLVFARGKGVWWQIERPYRFAYLLASDRVTEVSASGERVSRHVREVPGMAQAGRVFDALLRADLATLRTLFVVVPQGSAARWQAELKPRNPQVAAFVTRLAMKGGRFVEEIELEEANGDRTEIRLRNAHGASELAPADAAEFAP